MDKADPKPNLKCFLNSEAVMPRFKLKIQSFFPESVIYNFWDKSVYWVLCVYSIFIACLGFVPFCSQQVILEFDITSSEQRWPFLHFAAPSKCDIWCNLIMTWQEQWKKQTSIQGEFSPHLCKCWGNFYYFSGAAIENPCPGISG